MKKDLEFLAKDIYEIIRLSDELHRALCEHRLEDYYKHSTHLCVIAGIVANVIKGMS